MENMSGLEALFILNTGWRNEFEKEIYCKALEVVTQQREKLILSFKKEIIEKKLKDYEK